MPKPKELSIVINNHSKDAFRTPMIKDIIKVLIWKDKWINVTVKIVAKKTKYLVFYHKTHQ
jgi:hypothetical protein